MYFCGSACLRTLNVALAYWRLHQTGMLEPTDTLRTSTCLQQNTTLYTRYTLYTLLDTRAGGSTTLALAHSTTPMRDYSLPQKAIRRHFPI